MKNRDIVAEWLSVVKSAEMRSSLLKDSQGALDFKIAYYKELSPNHRTVVNELLFEELHSTIDSERFDATAIVRRFGIAEAVPDLRLLAGWLESQSWPGAPYEWQTVNQLIGELLSQD